MRRDAQTVRGEPKIEIPGALATGFMRRQPTMTPVSPTATWVIVLRNGGRWQTTYAGEAALQAVEG